MLPKNLNIEDLIFGENIIQTFQLLRYITFRQYDIRCTMGSLSEIILRAQYIILYYGLLDRLAQQSKFCAVQRKNMKQAKTRGYRNIMIQL